MRRREQYLQFCMVKESGMRLTQPVELENYGFLPDLIRDPPQ
jgi:hypothetical protein